MNPDSPQFSRDLLEARLTALVLGELTPAEEAEVRRALEQDPELSRLHDRIKATIPLVRESVVASTIAAGELPALQLSKKRRQRILRQFKIIAPKELAPSRWQLPGWLVPLAAAFAILGVIVGLLSSALGTVKSKARARYGPMSQTQTERYEVAKNLRVEGAQRRARLAGAETSKGAAPAGEPEAAPTKGTIFLPSLEEREAIGVAERSVGREPAKAASTASTRVLSEEGLHLYNHLAGTGGRQTPAGDTTWYFKNADAGLGGAGGFGGGGAGGFGGGQFGEFAGISSTEVNGRSGFWADGARTDWGKASDFSTLQVAGGRVASESSEKDKEAAGLHWREDEPGGRLALTAPVPAQGVAGVPEAGAGTERAFMTAAAAPVVPPVELAMEAPEQRGRDLFAGVAVQTAPVAGELVAPVTLAEPESRFALPITKAAKTPAPAKEFEPPAVQLPAFDVVDTPADVPASRASRGEEQIPTQDRVPVLGDAPMLGRLFRSERLGEAVSQTEAGEKLGKPIVPGIRRGGAVITDENSVGFGVQSTAPAAGQSSLELGALAPDLQQEYALGLQRYGRTAKGDATEAAAGRSRGVQTRRRQEAEVEQLGQKLDSAASGIAVTGQPARAPAQRLATLDDGIRKAQEKVDELSTKYNVSDSDEDVMSVSNERLSRSLRLNAKPSEEAAKEMAQADTKRYAGYFEAKAELKKLQDLREGLVRPEERLSEGQVLDAGLTPLAEEETMVVSRPVPAPTPQPEVATSANPFSTFSLNVSDVSFKLAASSLENGAMPDPASIRSEEFINAFDYHDPEPLPGWPLALTWDRARTPFAHNRDLLRLSLQTAARGREPGRPLNLVLLLDNSGSMERADRVAIIREALRVLAGQIQPQDKISVVAFSRTARLWIDGLPGTEAGELVERVGNLQPQGGTNLEDALRLAYETATRHYLPNGVNRVVLLTDGAANLGDVNPESLQQKVESNRKQGMALDCFGIGWEGYNDDLLEVLSRNGDGRYGFVNTAAEAAAGFANQLAGALQVAAADVKVQVEFNPQRVTEWRQIGYAKHQLTKEQFRDNTVDAAEIGAAETGNALYTIAVNPRGDGPLGIVRARFKVPATGDYREFEWELPYSGEAVALDQASPAMRLAVVAAAFSEWLASSPFAAEVTLDRLLGLMTGVPEVFGADARPQRLEWMIRQAKSLAGQ